MTGGGGTAQEQKKGSAIELCSTISKAQIRTKKQPRGQGRKTKRAGREDRQLISGRRKAALRQGKDETSTKIPARIA